MHNPHVPPASAIDKPRLSAQARILDGEIDMSGNKRVEKTKGDIGGSAPGDGKPAAAPLADEALDRVVGGYIGETEKNIRPAQRKLPSAS